MGAHWACPSAFQPSIPKKNSLGIPTLALNVERREPKEVPSQHSHVSSAQEFPKGSHMVSLRMTLNTNERNVRDHVLGIQKYSTPGHFQTVPL